MTATTATLSEQIEAELASASILAARTRSLLDVLEPLAAAQARPPLRAPANPAASGSAFSFLPTHGVHRMKPTTATRKDWAELATIMVAFELAAVVGLGIVSFIAMAVS